jgi:DNA-binding GntR family transcriptional regulator
MSVHANAVRAMRPDASIEAASRLQRRLAADIAAFVREERLVAGAQLNQLALAERFGVSRTPVRAALTLLAESGLIRLNPRGVEVANPEAALPAAAALAPAEDDDPIEALIAAVARDRHHGHLPEDVTEADLMRRYGEGRASIVAALRRLGELGLVARKAGFGWRFLVAAETADEKAAAYRFRLAIEPAALLEPGYTADPAWLDRIRRQHERYLRGAWRDQQAVAFFEMNAGFHSGLVGFSGNRFFIQATEQQNSLRRLRNYSWRLGPDRVRISCEEHLAVLEAVAARDMAEAARRMERHLAGTARLVARPLEAAADSVPVSSLVR